MKLSIIIPAYNLENYIERTLHSLRDQTVRNLFEIIIVDDGSIDSTKSVVERTLSNSDIINYRIISKVNGGVGSARNVGLNEASGEFVMFLDGDDYLSADMVEKLNEYCFDKEIDAICWGYDKVDENGATISKYFDQYSHIYNRESGAQFLYNMMVEKSMWIWTGSIAYRRNILNEFDLRYFEGCSNGEDQEFNIKALSRVNRVIFINETLAFYVDRQGSITNSFKIQKFDVINALLRSYEYLNNFGNDKLRYISEFLLYEHTISNYFYCLQSCIYNMNYYSLKTIFDLIDEEYPSMNRKMINIMRNYKGLDFKLKIKTKMFILNPNLYNKVIYFKRKFIDQI